MMIEERNVYWDYRNGHHTWRSKKFMDLTSESPPREISRVAYTKRGLRAKSPLWIFVKIGTEENQKIAAANIASTLCSVALASSKDLDILFNERTKSLILVLDCQYLINLFSYKVVDEKHANLVTIKNLIFNLFVETDIANQYEINEGNIIYFDFISVENFSPIKYRIEKIDIYNQQKFLDKLYSNIDCYMHQFKIIIDKISACHIFRDMKRYIIEYQGSENIRFASGLLQKTTKHLELPFLITHLAIKNSLDENSQGGATNNNKLIFKSKPIFNWNCKRLCNAPCGLHHPLDALSFTDKPLPYCPPQKSDTTPIPEKLTGVSPRLSKILNLPLDELPVLLFFASCLLTNQKLTVGDDTVSIFFPFLYINHNVRTIKSILSITDNIPYQTHCENKQLTKHDLAILLKTHNNVNFIGSDNTNTDILSLLLKRSRTSNQDIYQIKNAISVNINKKDYGRLNCISFCTNETLIKFRKSKAFRSGLLKHLILIRPDANPDKFSTATLKELLNSLKKNIHNIHNCREFFEKICYDFDVKLSIFNSNYTENPKYFLNYVKIIFILIIITFDEENITLIHGSKSRDYYRIINDSAIFLNKQLCEFSEKSMIDFNFTMLIHSMESFLSRYKHKFIYERELTRPFLESHNKKHIHDAIDMLCEKGRLVKGDVTTPPKIGRKSSQPYKITN
ncbi:hypothetical protein LI168_03950 [Desulfovibrio desulfuricans]|uniref:hypothetical protein n=2 Tax=Desulfovibrio desulfuricans TaxID=876 RepID=UPI001D096049|nr:hypothetical protein [Desulfovibrio desulfuricans]MCB6552373.1 hypothetical protein [Desulfovibrio desulfuricans]MCQ5218124.1 hypothetical protein [Desulfovibrio desulfuricans]